MVFPTITLKPGSIPKQPVSFGKSGKTKPYLVCLSYSLDSTETSMRSEENSPVSQS